MSQYNRDDGVWQRNREEMERRSEPIHAEVEPHISAIPPNPNHNGAGDLDEDVYEEDARRRQQFQQSSAPRRRGVVGKLLDKGQAVVYFFVPPGGVLASAFNLAASSVGAGILGLPAATDTTGLLLALIYLLIITFFSIYSMHILAITVQKTRIRSFEGLGRWLFPRGNYAFSYWTAFIRWFHGFSACVAFIISVQNAFNPIFKEALEKKPDNSALKYFNTTSGSRLLASLVWLCIMLPLVIPKHVDSLRYVSTIAVCMMIYFVVVIVIHSCTHGLPLHQGNVELSHPHFTDDTDGKVYLFRTGNPVVQGVGVFMFAYVCQMNAVEVFWDMRPEIRNVKNYTLASFIGMMICGILYVFVCVFGYFDFGSKAIHGKSILLMYKPLSEPEMMVGYVGVLLKLCVSYALLCLGCRNSVYYMLGWQQKYATPKNKRRIGEDENRDEVAVGNVSPVESGREAYVDSPNVAVRKNGMEKAAPNAISVEEMDAEDTLNDAEDMTYIDNIPFWKHLIVVLILAVASLMCGLFIPSINMVFGFAGAISGAFIAFIFPALFFMYAGNFSLKESGFWNFFLTYAMLLCGVIGVVFGTAGTIYITAINY